MNTAEILSALRAINLRLVWDGYQKYWFTIRARSDHKVDNVSYTKVSGIYYVKVNITRNSGKYKVISKDSAWKWAHVPDNSEIVIAKMFYNRNRIDNFYMHVESLLTRDEMADFYLLEHFGFIRFQLLEVKYEV
jgi:hypothetical protein